jgi:hypothetical protein
MRSVVAAGVLLVLLAAGCGSVSDESAGLARGTRSSAPPSYDRNELAAQTRKALMAPDAVTGLDGPVRTAEVVDGHFTTAYYCFNHPNDEGRSGHVGHERRWTTPTVTISHVVHGYYRKTAFDAVAQVRTSIREACGSFAVSGRSKMYTDGRAEGGDNVKYELLGPVDFANPAGAEDSIGQCHKESYRSGQQRVVCAAYLGRENLVSAVFVSAGMNEAAARTKLLQIIPTAATVLAAT